MINANWYEQVIQGLDRDTVFRNEVPHVTSLSISSLPDKARLPDILLAGP